MNPESLKICVVGEEAVGKTCFCQMVSKGAAFDAGYEPTQGMDVYRVDVPGGMRMRDKNQKFII